jgi:hypothetical protein
MSGTSTPLVFDGTSAAVLPGARVAIAVARWNESVTRRHPQNGQTSVHW